MHPFPNGGAAVLHPVMIDHGVLKPTSPATLALAVVSGAWATAGASWAMYFAEEMTDARRRIGRVIAWAGVIASLTIAAPVALLVAAAPDIKGMLAAEAPFAFFLERTAGPVVAALVSVGVFAAIFNNVIATTLGLSRLVYATGRDGAWPPAVNRFLTLMHPKAKAPTAATLLLGALGSAACFIPPEVLIILLAGEVFGQLLISLAVLIGRRRGLTGRFFSAPLYPLVPIFGLVSWAAFVAANFADPKAGRPSMALLSAVFFGSLAYHVWKRRRTGRAWEMQPLDEDAEVDLAPKPADAAIAAQ
jgi:amino acid transporter